MLPIKDWVIVETACQLPYLNVYVNLDSMKRGADGSAVFSLTLRGKHEKIQLSWNCYYRRFWIHDRWMWLGQTSACGSDNWRG